MSLWIHRSPTLSTFLDLELRNRWEDLLSKARRTEKRLKKAFLSMVSQISDDLLEKNASPIEVLVACGVAVWQGYWYSSATETQKKGTLDAFGRFLFTIVLNECYLPSDSPEHVAGLHSYDAIGGVEERFRHLFMTRTEEYTDGVLVFMNGEKFPVKLAQTLSHNLLRQESRGWDREQKDLWDATILALVALPFVATFSVVMKET